MRKLPPLNSLRAFEAAARHMNFAKAADELGVTATAISHQIKLLEDTIGFTLFIRQPRPMKLTEYGERLFPEIQNSLDHIAQSIEGLTASKNKSTLRISTTVAFASHILLPNLNNWTKKYPGIELDLHASNDPVNFIADNIDVAVRYSSKPKGNLIWQELCRDRYKPMRSPSLFIEPDNDLCAEIRMLKLPLIFYRWSKPDPIEPTWERWRKAAEQKGVDLPCISTAHRIKLSGESHALEAAIAGQGITLASLVITQTLRANNKLVIASDIELPGLSYYLVHPPKLCGDLRVAQFQDWLQTLLKPST